MNTSRILHRNIAVSHMEGGWPKDVNTQEPENVARWRKKLEKDEEFQMAVPIMAEVNYNKLFLLFLINTSFIKLVTIPIYCRKWKNT